MDTTYIGVVDYVFFLGTLIISMAIGVYFAMAQKKKTAKELLAAEDMSVWPITFSLLAASLSGISILGFPTEVYSFGTLIVEVAAAQLVFIPLFGYIILPIFYNLKLTSVYEYLEMRYQCRYVRWLAMSIFLLEEIMYLGVVLFAPCVALNAVVNIPVWLAIICVGGCATIYTAIGGLKAVVWIEFFQAFMMLAGLLAVIIQGAINVGGFGNAFEILDRHQRLNFLDFRTDPFIRQTSLGLFFSQGLLWGGLYSTFPVHVLRFCSMRTLRDTKKTLLLSAVVMAAMVVLTVMCGVFIFATYADCDPIKRGLIWRSDQVLPFFVVEYLAVVPGLLGLFMAALFSGTLSSISSNLNAMTTIIWEDCLKHTKTFGGMDDRHQNYVVKGIALFAGCLGMAFSFIAGNLGEILTVAMSLTGATRGCILGLFVLSLFVPFAEKRGAAAALALSAVIMLGTAGMSVNYRHAFPPLPTSVDKCGVNETVVHVATTVAGLLSDRQPGESHVDWPERIFTLSYVLIPLLGVTITVVVGCIVSLICKGQLPLSELEGLVHPTILRLHHKLLKRMGLPSEPPRKPIVTIQMSVSNNPSPNHTETDPRL